MFSGFSVVGSGKRERVSCNNEKRREENGGVPPEQSDARERTSTGALTVPQGHVAVAPTPRRPVEPHRGQCQPYGPVFRKRALQCVDHGPYHFLKSSSEGGLNLSGLSNKSRDQR